MEAVKRVDAAVQSGLTEKGLKYNESLNDFMFVRRVYTDLAGRIPTYNELIQFLASSDQAKRKNLVDKLIGTEDYVSHNFNYFADLCVFKQRFQERFYALTPLSIGLRNS